MIIRWFPRSVVTSIVAVAAVTWAAQACDTDDTPSAGGASGVEGQRICGNGNVEDGEECDDGNLSGGDGCTADCFAESDCGDGVVSDSETCDDGFTDACGTCNADCSGAGEEAVCGDGAICPELEECDHGVDGSSACTTSCESAVAFVAIPGGAFDMGSKEGEGDANERPRHAVTVPEFEMMAAEVTVDEYQACVDAGACDQPNTGAAGCNWGINGRGQHPANCVSWNKSVAYCAWVGGRLPSEAEWEYAARSGGQDIAYPWGNEIPTCEYAILSEDITNGCGAESTWAVCSKPDGNSAHGLCDMAGNVWEWVQDRHHESYDGAPADGSAWEDGTSTNHRVMRGGGWRDSAENLRVENRYHSPSEGAILGFRCARTR